jgi:hypothetical protein
MGQHLVFGLMVVVGSVIFYQVFLLLRVSLLPFVIVYVHHFIHI